MDGNITMSQKEAKNYDIIKKVISQELDGREASDLLGYTIRHIRRLKGKVIKEGIKGLIHAHRGKPGNRRIPDEEKERIISLIKENYYDFGPLLATEKLNERDKITRDKGTIRNLMIKEGIWKTQKKKKEIHREWRQRKAHKGEILQYDGSYEYWFEDRGANCCLLLCIDDADSEIWAKFDEHEGVFPTFNFWREYIEQRGKPNAIYVDRFSTYSMNHKLAKENPDTLTQFERAMKELNIGVIHAHSPEAKGRVENVFYTLQDRLIKELRLQNISSVKEANEFLEKEFLPKFNAKFMVEARSKANLHKKLNELEKRKLDSIFSRQNTRVVRNDFTICHNTEQYQLEKVQPVTICKRDVVIAEDRPEGSLNFRLRGKNLNYHVLPKRQVKINSRKANALWVIPKSSAHTVLAKQSCY